jgi:hypothetical protein
MKKFIFTLFSTALFVACSTHDKTVELPAEKPVTKTIEFTIASHGNYSASYYDSASSEIKLIVYKPLDNPNREEIIWDTVIARKRVKEYMQMPTPIIVTKQFPVIESKEKIGAGYSSSFIMNSSDYPTWSASRETAAPGSTTLRVSVGI